MAAPNPFFAVQSRLTSLVAAHAYFAGVPATQFLTEAIADLQYEVNQRILESVGFGIVVTTAEGKARENEYGALLTEEDLNISIVHNPQMDPAHNAVDAEWAVIEAIHGQSVYALGANLGAPTEKDFFRVEGHQRRLDGPAGFNCREVHVRAGLRLL